MRAPRRLGWAGAAYAVSFGGALVARRMRDQFGRAERLSPATVGAMYAAYASYLAVLFAAALKGRAPLPISRRWAGLAGGAAIGSGLVLLVAGAGSFRSTAQLSGLGDRTLHSSGVYRYSRNPQYLGASMALGGVALAGRSGLALVLALEYPAMLQWFWIPVEEAHLRRVFGDDYEGYVREVHRWLGRRRVPSPSEAGSRRSVRRGDDGVD